MGRGWRISGSDLQPSAAEGLSRSGVEVSAGHASSNVPKDAKLLVYSEAVAAENPERLEAQRRGMMVRSYAEMLGEIANESQMAEGQVAAVAGTHGKSTVTAMAGEILIRAGLDPTVICGAAPVHCDPSAESARTIEIDERTARKRRRRANQRANLRNRWQIRQGKVHGD